jgi:hypothetical protein
VDLGLDAERIVSAQTGKVAPKMIGIEEGNLF